MHRRSGDCQDWLGKKHLPTASCLLLLFCVIFHYFLFGLFLLCEVHNLLFMLTSMKSFLSAVVQLLSCLGFFLKEGKEIAIGENLKRWCLLWERKQHQAVAGWTSSCEVPPSKLGLLPDLFLSCLLRKFCLCALTHREITSYLAWIEEKQYQLLPLLSLSQT